MYFSLNFRFSLICSSWSSSNLSMLLIFVFDVWILKMIVWFPSTITPYQFHVLIMYASIRVSARVRVRFDLGVWVAGHSVVLSDVISFAMWFPVEPCSLIEFSNAILCSRVRVRFRVCSWFRILDLSFPACSCCLYHVCYASRIILT